jgi:hypothetical protein
MKPEQLAEFSWNLCTKMDTSVRLTTSLHGQDGKKERVNRFQ